jgi:hypothetical protein
MLREQFEILIVVQVVVDGFLSHRNIVQVLVRFEVV